MIPRKERSEKVDQKKAPTAEELRAATWTQIEGVVTLLMKIMFEILLDQASCEQIGALPYQRTSQRKGQRNGSYRRSLLTRFGAIDELSVPRLRKGSLLHTLFAPYQQRTDELDKAIGTLFLNGVSTHKLRGITEQLTGRSVSPQTVSQIMEKTDPELERYRTRPLEDKYEFLFLDGIYDKVRDLGLERNVLLCALGITKEGRKEILAFRLTETESEENWTEFITDLKHRGLAGKHLRLITTDGNPGLKKVLKRLFPYKRHQRCIWHKMNNIQGKTRKANRKALMSECKGVFAAPSRKEAIARFKAWRAHWEASEPSAVTCLAKNLRECLVYYDFPKDWWTKIRTTNILERSFREVRRRTRPMGGTFVNPSSQERIYGNVFGLLNNNWKKHPINFTHKT